MKRIIKKASLLCTIGRMLSNEMCELLVDRKQTTEVFNVTLPEQMMEDITANYFSETVTLFCEPLENDRM